MKPQVSHQMVQPSQVSELLFTHFANLMSEFYEMQSMFLSKRYKVHQSLETSSIIISLIKNTHLAILRQREKHLDHDISLENFFNNLEIVKNDPDSLERTANKIVTLVNATSIPKETVRRKLKKLEKDGFLKVNKYKEYFWTLEEKRKDNFIKIMKADISGIAKFVSNISKFLNINLPQKEIEKEIKKQFSFYFYHFLNCQITWLNMWQNKIKDIDLVLISLQALIPTLQCADKNIKIQGLENTYKFIGHTDENYKLSSASISAASISQVTGIPRATCIRKLEKLVVLGMLVREEKTKRYYVNRQAAGRTKHIITKENINFTIKTFSEYLSIIINAISRNLISRI
tara:strand:+ start:27 stop:1061 length:1035 start_codon:yes stop_codon:yes gene_type:complete